jgi:hypothetical protein
MKINSYSLFARALPSLLVLIPFFIIYYFLLRPIIGNFLVELLAIKIATDITLPVALFFLMIQLNRIVAKEIFEKRIFNYGLNFPTTDLLLHNNSFYSAEYTKKIHNRIKSDFGIKIPSENEEIKDEQNSRKIINEAINQINYKIGKGILVEQHNSEYGFIRNLSGGSILAIIMSFINIIIFTWIFFDKVAFIISCITLSLYFLFVLFSKKMILIVGLSYAKILIKEYMASS